MKLKFLFFPFSLVVATVLTIWFIWPTWFDPDNGIVAIQRELEERRVEIESIKAKKNNINSLKTSLGNESSSRSLTEKYYPQEKNTETIINEINYFSSSAGTSVSDVKVDIVETTARSGGNKQACLPVLKRARSAAPTAVASDEMQSAIEESSPVIIDVNINVIGGYRNIRDFITRLSGTEIINNVYSMDINKKDVSQGEAVAAEGGVLGASIGVCFGYLPESTVRDEGEIISHRIFSLSRFDFDYINRMNEAIYRPASTIEIGGMGKDNPFAP